MREVPFISQVVYREIALTDYETVLAPDELITSIRLPLPQPHTGSVYCKFLPRTADDYATVGVAASVRLNPSTGLCEDCRIAMGCVAVTPVRAVAAETLLRGQEFSEALESGLGIGGVLVPELAVPGSDDAVSNLVDLYYRLP